jgi:4a-hydroxytetrahydrobiopterin dehydratase
MKLANENCRDGAPKLAADELGRLLAVLPGWTIDDIHLSKRFAFADFKAAMLFANAIGWIAEAQNHHPDLAVGWGYCHVMLTTHAAGGLTRNDLIVAARVERLLAA